MRIKILSLLCLSSFVTACSTPTRELTEKGRNVRILTEKPVKTCEVVDKVIGENDIGSLELAQNHARNLAGKKEANALYIEQELTNGSSAKVYAVAYYCR